MVFEILISKLRFFIFMSLFLFLASCDEVSCKIPFAEEQNITEEDAISITRQALKEAGIDTTQIEPAPYWENSNNSEKFLARNSSDKNQGYVLWRIKSDDKKKFHYSVSLKKEGSYVICNGGLTK